MKKILSAALLMSSFSIYASGVSVTCYDFEGQRVYTATPATGTISVTDFEDHLLFNFNDLVVNSHQIETLPPIPVTEFLDAKTDEVVFTISQSVGEPVSASSYLFVNEEEKNLDECLINF